MSGVQPLELLRATHTFPTPYVFKTIGHAGRSFEHRVVLAIQSELDLAEPPASSLRETPGGRHVAVTVEVQVASAEQILAVYARLRLLADLVMML